MGQQDIIQFLRKEKEKWFNASDISEKLNVSIGSVLACLRRLRKSKLVDFDTIKAKAGTVKKNIFVYRFKKEK